MPRLGISGGDYVDGLDTGCDRVLALGSVGGLRRELDVGTFLCPDDFIALHAGKSAFDDRRSHVVPGFDADWRERVVAEWSRRAAPPLRDGGVYWESIGPRFETRAEIRLIARHADVIGMTIASECVIASELGLPYAAICIVDNLANGVGERQLTVDEFEAGRERNRRQLAAAVSAVVPALTGGAT